MGSRARPHTYMRAPLYIMGSRTRPQCIMGSRVRAPDVLQWVRAPPPRPLYVMCFRAPLPIYYDVFARALLI